MTATRIVLATTDPDYERRLRAAYAGALNGDLRTLSDEVLAMPAAQAVAVIAGSAPTVEVVALGPGLPIDASLELAHRFDVERPDISVVLIASPSPELWAKAMRAGVRDLLDPHAATTELHEVMERASESAARRRATLTPTPPAEPAGMSGHVITVISPKGGSGKTTVATNLAVGLAQAVPDGVVLVDLDLQFGDVASALQLLPEHTMADAVRTPHDLDTTVLKMLLTPHASGMYALCAPETPAEGEQISGEAVGRIIQRLATEFRYVVVDSSAGLSEHTLAAMEQSTDVAAVCSMDVPSVCSLRKVLDALDQIAMTAPRRHVVLNRADSRVGLSVADVEATIGLPVNVQLPSNRAIPLALNQGTPLLSSDARHPVSRQLQTLVERFVDQPAPTRGRLAKWRAAR